MPCRPRTSGSTAPCVRMNGSRCLRRRALQVSLDSPFSKLVLFLKKQLKTDSVVSEATMQRRGRCIICLLPGPAQQQPRQSPSFAT